MLHMGVTFLIIEQTHAEDVEQIESIGLLTGTKHLMLMYSFLYNHLIYSLFLAVYYNLKLIQPKKIKG